MSGLPIKRIAPRLPGVNFTFLVVGRHRCICGDRGFHSASSCRMWCRTRIASMMTGSATAAFRREPKSHIYGLSNPADGATPRRRLRGPPARGLSSPPRTDARLVKAGRRPGSMLAGMKPRIKAARPFPLVDINRNAGTLADRSYMHVVKIDVPGDMVRVVGAAAGECGHPP